ncbi:MAG: membrane protein insertion efficiency factor YidD [Pseudomonadota bacterium]
MKAGRILVGWVIRGYQLMVSPYMAPSCRFEPTCSSYAHQAILTHGLGRGGWLVLRRLGRCHPWGGAGYDPVPEPEHKARECCQVVSDSQEVFDTFRDLPKVR